MDVKCERCNTEYEFDDALVSGRGTTVKCTNCGHKFKIRRKDGDYSEDFWNVTTADNRTLVFTSLRELQRAIQTHLVDRNDKLSRGGLPPKPIGQIPELTSFFDQRDKAAREPPPMSVPPRNSLEGVAGTGARKSSRPPPPPGSSLPFLAAPARQRQVTRPDFPPQSMPAELLVPKKTLVGTPPDPALSSSPPPRPPSVAPTTEREKEPDTERYKDKTKSPEKETPRAQPAAPPAAAMRSTPPPLPARASRTPTPAPVVATAPIAPPQVAASTSTSGHEIDVSSPLPPAPRMSYASETDEVSESMRVRTFSDAPSSMGRRRGVGGFIVAGVVLLGLGVLGAVWAKDHLGSALGGGRTPAPTATTDPRAIVFLDAGEKALADGNLEFAKESFDKASALAEKDGRVLLDQARLAAIRADGAWLKSRLLPEDAAEEHRITRDTLGDLAATARKAADNALAVTPDDPAALRAKIDALRISGDRDGARALVSKVGANASQPESAYVLAALDLAEAAPLWSTVIERLRSAAGSETGPGRARAALVYALALSGDAAGAKAEIDRLAALPRVHPLLPLLRQFAARTAKAPIDAGTPTVAAGNLPPAPGEPATPGGKKPLSNDPRQLVAQGDTARHKGDYDRARQLYAAALDRNANDSEALYGLAAIAHAQRDLAGAKASYKRVLAINPRYLPALIGSADVDWESGDKASAIRVYKDIVDVYPETAYPARVKQRAEGGGG